MAQDTLGSTMTSLPVVTITYNYDSTKGDIMHIVTKEKNANIHMDWENPNPDGTFNAIVECCGGTGIIGPPEEGVQLTTDQIVSGALGMMCPDDPTAQVLGIYPENPRKPGIIQDTFTYTIEQSDEEWVATIIHNNKVVLTIHIDLTKLTAEDPNPKEVVLYLPSVPTLPLKIKGTPITAIAVLDQYATEPDNELPLPEYVTE